MPFGPSEMSYSPYNAGAYWKHRWSCLHRSKMTQVDTTIHSVHTRCRHAMCDQHLPYGVGHRQVLYATLGVFPATQRVPAWSLESASRYYHTHFRDQLASQHAYSVRVRC